jgi:sensor histidine kinase regulating citrate/malate metabolism
MLFVVVTLCSILIEIVISRTLSRKIKKRFLEFAEDLEGTKYLVDSMRANNHDFTNKLHVILGLIQIGEYEKAISYIENISIIQRETISTVMKSVENASFAALLIGKIARASECNVKFILKEGICYKNADINIPSEALVTISGNLIENALEAMNMKRISLQSLGSNGKKESSENSCIRELIFGVYTKPGECLITVEDNGCGIPENIKNRIFERGFSTKGQGRGTGLYHIKQLVESLGGTLSFESREGIGSVFAVSFKEA